MAHPLLCGIFVPSKPRPRDNSRSTHSHFATLPGAIVAVCSFLAVGLSPRNAAAYSYESAVSVGCHERITMRAMRNLRTDLPQNALPIIPGSNEQALIADVPFALDNDMKDLAATTFVVGVRDNDLHGNGPSESDQLAKVHGDPANQREHCLRGPDDDEPDGSARALEACKGFIREKMVDALNGLDAQSRPDPEARMDLEVTLDLRGRVTASLPRFWVRVGQATHAMQDSFTHSFRSPDRLKVRTVLNYIDVVEDNHSEGRDGPEHRSGLDACEDLDELRTQNMGVAQQATVELIKPMLDPTIPRDAKLAAVDGVLTKYLSLDPGCTEANGWCDAPERKYEINRSCGCSMIGRASNDTIAITGCALAFGLLTARRRRRIAKARHAAKAAALTTLLVATLVTTASTARAQSETPAQPAPSTDPSVAPPAVTPAPAPVNAPPPQTTTHPETGAQVAVDKNAAPPGVPTTDEVKAEKREEEHRSLFGIHVGGSGSITNPALNGQLGIRFRLSERWSVGLDGELNGWYGEQTTTLRLGAFNAYGTVIFHYPLRFQQVNLRSTANLGTSTMMLDLYGAPRGTTGIFVGLVPLGLEWKVSSTLYVIFDALGVAVPVPQLKGAPFAYPQYRTAVGLEITF